MDKCVAFFWFSLLMFCSACAAAVGHAEAVQPSQKPALQKRWLFEWRNLSDPTEVDRMIAQFPRAAAAGYNGIVFSPNVAREKVSEIRDSARQNHLDLVAIVMGGVKDRNYTEGVLAKDALFVAHDGRAVFQPDNPTRVPNGDFEDATG